MPDAVFQHSRLVAIYDALDPDRRDLDPYAAMVDEFGAREVVDLGCGTGILARILAARGVTVTGVDPASGSLAHARSMPGADRVRWVLGDATAMPIDAADLVLMTGNAAQAILDWNPTLQCTHRALRPGGRLVFETRDPAARGWESRTRTASHRVVEIAGVGAVETWVELTTVALPLLSFRQTWVFADGAVLTSDSTLRFRSRSEITTDLARHGFAVEDVRNAPDRPGPRAVLADVRVQHERVLLKIEPLRRCTRPAP